MAKTDADRNKFEAWAKDQPFAIGIPNLRIPDGTYASLSLEVAWETWQSCAASKNAEIQALREALRKAIAYGRAAADLLDDTYPRTESDMSERWSAFTEAERVLAETEAV